MPRCKPYLRGNSAVPLGLALALWFAPAAMAAEPAEFFRQQVAPLLETRCLRCHQGLTARANLSLETRESLLAGGDSGPAMEPGDAQSSLLTSMIAGDEPAMPQEGPPLTGEEITVLNQWIDEGAHWPEEVTLRAAQGDDRWWSLTALARPEVPVDDSSWVRNPIDAFIVRRLHEADLEPAPEADRRTLARRLFYDLHGLPPSPEELKVFLEDEDPLAYERLVDRLLDSPRYGERWGRHWLDVAHYGETHGYDKDKRRNHAWPYRDYVIRALNLDKPYARFIEEQVAGDVLWPDDADTVIATGFLAAGPWDFVGHVELREGTMEKQKTRLIDRDDMLATTLGTFASLTVHCARCHDHPFDPISQQEYYRLQAVFAGVDRADRPYPDPAWREKRESLERQREALVRHREEIEARIASLQSDELLALDQQLESHAAVRGALVNPLSREGEPVDSPTNGYHSAIEAEQDVTKWVQVDLGGSHTLQTICLVPARPIDFADTPGFGFPLRFQVTVSDDADFAKATLLARYHGKDFPNPGNEPVVIDANGAQGRYIRITAERLWPRGGDYVFALGELIVESADDEGRLLEVKGVTALDSIEAGRWSMRHLVDGCSSRHRLPAADDPALREYLAQRVEHDRRVTALRVERDHAQRVLKRDATKRDDARHIRMLEAKIQVEMLPKRLARIDAELEALASPPQVYALASHEPRPIHLLARGEVTQPAEAESLPGALACIEGMPADFVVDDLNLEGSRRRELARWLSDERNTLVWRSIANRVWQYHFGRGLVETPSDLGRNGAAPSHPQLLDWLAVEFRDGGQSLKALHRLMVTSATYRQVSRHDSRAAELDGDNRLLWRMNRRRLDAEELRDSVLQVSGKLDLTMGGPSFELFEFEDDHSPRYLYVPMDRPEAWRRTIYRFVVRSVPNPFLESFDCPDPSLSTPVRTTTITALQALALLNDPFIVRQSEYLAARLEREAGSDLVLCVQRAFELTLSRLASAEELSAVTDYAAAHGLANACRVLLNGNEFAFVD